MRYRVEGCGPQVEGFQMGSSDSATEALVYWAAAHGQFGGARVFDREGGELREEELRRRAEAERVDTDAHRT